jgi:hypothetical protein
MMYSSGGYGTALGRYHVDSKVAVVKLKVTCVKSQLPETTVAKRASNKRQGASGVCNTWFFVGESPEADEISNRYLPVASRVVDV